MQFLLLLVGLLVGLVARVSSHGLVTKPETRTPGPATASACGNTMATFYRADNTSYPEALLRANPNGLTDGFDAGRCNLWLCKGYQFADNVANVKTYTPGQLVDLEVWIRIAHRGYANVSIVDTGANKIIGAPLLVWPENYAASTSPPTDQVKFSVKIPELAGRCVTPGVCVLQWYWFGAGQTYESCVDFVVEDAAPVHEHSGMIRGRSWRG